MQRTADDVFDLLVTLPPERVEEVYDFALFLKTRCASAVDESDEWSEADRRDVTAASLKSAESLEPEDDS